MWRWLLACVPLWSVLSVTPGSAATWDHAHGNAANTGFADVLTRPATGTERTVADIGTFAPGAGPVIGPDGTVYLGNEQGWLWAFHADGTFYWKRRLDPGRRIVASPVVDTDGSIYVIGEYTYTDHRVSPAAKRTDSTLYRFTNGGGFLWGAAFPERFGYAPQFASRGATSAAPNIWRSGSDMAVIIPVIYKRPNGEELHVFAYSAFGVLLKERFTTLYSVPSQTTGDDGGFWGHVGCAITFCRLAPGFSPTIVHPDPYDLLPDQLSLPMASVAIYTFPGGGLPWVIVNDPWQETIGYTFSLTDGFVQHFRQKQPALRYAASPMVLPDGHSVIPTDHGLSFAGPNGAAMAAPDADYTYATPALTSHQQLAVGGARQLFQVGDGFRQETRVSFLQQAQVVAGSDVFGETIAPPAASRSHVFVSAASSFTTFNATTMQLVAHVYWTGGGQSSPAIGPSGRVYALASNILFVWPAPLVVTCRICGGPIAVGPIQPSH